MSIELYVFPPSPRAFKVLVVANHLMIDFTTRFVNLVAGDHQQPTYAALNPNMRMPTLTDGDFTLWESNAICQYLATMRPDSGLMPPDPRGNADVARWMFWESAHWDSACAAYIFQHLVKPLLGMGAPAPAALTAAEAPFQRAAKVLDGHLRGKDFIAGGRLSLADFSVGAMLITAEAAKYPLEPYAEIKRWYAGISALPAWRKTMDQRQALLKAA
ncbi:MAG: glutathione S-transferase family protein [Rhodospirillaceae bacterium]